MGLFKRTHYRKIGLLYNSAPCGLHSLDKDAVFVSVNETELRWLGYTRDELVGKKEIFDLLAPEIKHEILTVAEVATALTRA